MTERTADWSLPTSIRFGAGRIRELPDACDAAGIRHPLVVTDANLAGLAFMDDAVRTLRDTGLAADLFTDVAPNPSGADVDTGVTAFRDGAHDGVVAIGGGTALDTGKTVAFMAGQGRPIWDFEDRYDWWKRADTSRIAPVVAVPTTAGTGSEVGRASVIFDAAANTKKIIFHPRMLPAQVIADPELTAGLPPAPTAATGMDALSHNLEAFCASGFNPFADGIALEGMRLVHTSLRRAFDDGVDLDARAGMLAASMMGATAFQKGLGALHAMSHPCSAVFGTHHGLTNGVLLPYVLAHNRPAIEDRVGTAAKYLGVGNGSFDSFTDWILDLRSAIGIPDTLGEIGVQADAIGEMAQMAAVDPSGLRNPLAIDASAYETLYRIAFGD